MTKRNYGIPPREGKPYPPGCDWARPPGCTCKEWARAQSCYEACGEHSPLTESIYTWWDLVMLYGIVIAVVGVFAFAIFK